MYIIRSPLRATVVIELHGGSTWSKVAASIVNKTPLSHDSGVHALSHQNPTIHLVPIPSLAQPLLIFLIFVGQVPTGTPTLLREKTDVNTQPVWCVRIYFSI